VRKPDRLAGVIVALVVGLLAFGSLHGWAEDNPPYPVERKPEPVTKNDKIDKNDEEIVAPEHLVIAGGNITITSRTFEPKEKEKGWMFKSFGTTHVDIHKQVPADGLSRYVVPPTADNDTETRIRVEAAGLVSDAAEWPLRCEGNLEPPPGPPGPPVTIPHWSAKVTKQKFDLIVHNGLDGPEVSEENEEKVGAFSVANLNNTDGDYNADGSARVDKDETGADADNQIANEKDMIKVIIKKVTNETIAGDVTLTITGDGTKTELWKAETKADGKETSRSWSIASLPVTVWVEGLDKSAAVRDIEVVLTKSGGAGGGFNNGDVLDKAKLTFVWATRTGAEFNRQTAAQLLAADAWKNMTIPPKNYFIGNPPHYDGTGLLPLKVVGDTMMMYNCMAMKFAFEPANVWKEPGVKFDISRQASSKGWAQIEGKWELFKRADDPGDDETANDDKNDFEESSAPNADGEMFEEDAPGADVSPGVSNFVYRSNFREFVRVRFDGTKPAGNGLSGSRCSDRFIWHCRHSWTNDNGWARDPGANLNDIVDGPPLIDIGENP